MVLQCFKLAGSNGMFSVPTIVLLCQKLLLIPQPQATVKAMWSVCKAFKMPTALKFVSLSHTAWRKCKVQSFQVSDHVQSSALPHELTLQAVSSTLTEMASPEFQEK